MRSLRGENETPMVTARSEECQCGPTVLEFASFTAHSGRSKSMHLWSLAKVFHTCGKNCGKSRGSRLSCAFMAGNRRYDRLRRCPNTGENRAKSLFLADDYPKK